MSGNQNHKAVHSDMAAFLADLREEGQDAGGLACGELCLQAADTIEQLMATSSAAASSGGAALQSDAAGAGAGAGAGQAVDYRALLRRYMAAVIADDPFIGERCAAEDGGDYTPQQAAALLGLVSEIRAETDD